MVDEKKFAQISVESVLTWGEAAGASELTHELGRLLAADVTYRLRQVLSVCSHFLSHSNRSCLNVDDVNRALKWMDVPSIHGHSGNEAVDYVSVPQVGVFIDHDPVINLASLALSGDIFHQPGSPYIKSNWVHICGHKRNVSGEDKEFSPLPLTYELNQYYETLFSVVAGPSNDLFKVMCGDLSSSPNIEPLVGVIVGGVVRGVQKARQKPALLQRLLLVLRCLKLNPYINIGPQNYMRDIINVLTSCIINERKNPIDSQTVRTLASNILLQVLTNCSGNELEIAVNNLTEVVNSSTRPWSHHVGAISGLMCLGSDALYKAFKLVANAYENCLFPLLNQCSVSNKDICDAQATANLVLNGLVKITSSLIQSLPDKIEINLPCNMSGENGKISDVMKKLKEIYMWGESVYGANYVLMTPSCYLCLSLPTFFQSDVYKDKSVSWDTFLRDSRKRPVKRGRKYSSKSSLCVFGRDIFEREKLISPVRERKIYFNIHGCKSYTTQSVKKKRLTVKTERNSGWSVKGKEVGRMPHTPFLRPFYPPLRAGYSLQYLVL